MDEQHVKAVLEEAPMGTFMADTEGNCIYVNKEWERMSGLSFEASLGKGWFNIVLEEDKPMVIAVMEDYLQPPYIIPDHGFRIRHPKIGVRQMLVKGKLPLDGEGKPRFIIGYVQDVTEDRQNMLQLQALALSLERLNFLLDESQAISKTGGWEYNILTGEVYWTPQTFLIMVNEVAPGFTPTYHHLTSFCEESYAWGLEECAMKAINEGIPYDYEFRHVLGKWLRVIGVPVIKDGKVTKLRGAVMDITDIKEYQLTVQQTKEALKSANELLEISQELNKTGGWEWDVIKKELFWTKQTYAIYGLPEGYKPSFEKSMDFFEGKIADTLRQVVTDTIRDKTSFNLELPTTTPGGEKKWIQIIGVPYLVDGEAVLLRGAIMDITEKKENEFALISARNKAEEAARAKSEFLSVMSHEIRTPLNGIIGTTSLLELDHTPSQAEYINNLSFSASHLLDLINNILDLNKAESGKMKLETTPVVLPELVRDILSQFRPQAEAKGIRLVMDLGPGIPRTVLGDPMRLNQIMNNLVSNAIKYTQEGEVVIALHLLSVTSEETLIHFSVKDTGIGIPEELHETVFENFMQLQQVSTRKHSGTGLGLAITRRLIALHNSRIALSSKPGEGSEFYFDIAFRLPVRKSVPGPSRQEDLAAYKQKFKGLRVLFVEDNPVNMVVAKGQLEFFGIVPDCAASAREAITLLEEHKYDMALLDLHMPEIDGYALAAIILAEYPDIHIVIFTADILDEVRTRLAKMNIHDLLHKPFMPRDMLNVLQRVTHQQALKERS